MTNYDPTVQRVIDQVAAENEMEYMLKNRREYAVMEPVGDSGLEGLTRAVTSTASEVPMWNRETGEQSMVIFDAVRARANQRFPLDHPNKKFAGQKVYTIHEPGCKCGLDSCEPAPRPVRGKLACPLSPLHDDRGEVEGLGFGHIICPKPAYFATEEDVNLHVEKSHPRFHRIRERARERAEREEQRKQNETLQAALATLLTGQAAPAAADKAEPPKRGRNGGE